MISASNDSQQQEQLIEKYMSLPNQVWDDIINQAAKNVSTKFPYIVTVSIDTIISVKNGSQWISNKINIPHPGQLKK